MRLLSFLKRKSEEAAAAPAKPRAGARASTKASASPDPADSVQQARIRARQRLIGAVVLVVAGVIGFPLLFETQPRPMPVDTPIDIARRDTSVQYAPVPAQRPAASPAALPPQGRMVTGTVEDAGRVVPPPPPAALPVPEAPQMAPEPVEPKLAEARPAEPKPAQASASKPAAVAVKPSLRPASAPERTPPAKPDASRAQALLEGGESAKKPQADAAGARFIVQVGAFSEMPAARDVRQKVEKLGLKTYTQVVETSAGSRIRVRVGPFSSRADADKAAGKLKSAGLSPAVFTL